MRRIRLWTCPCCHRQWNRLKGARAAVLCPHCGRTHTEPGRTFVATRTCAHDRAEAFNDALGKYPRTRTQRRFQPTPAINAAWRECRKAKTRPALLRRLGVWSALLLAESRDEARFPDRWRKEARVTAGHLDLHKSRGGAVGMPTLVTTTEGGIHGRYRRSLLGGYKVELNVDKAERGYTLLDTIRRTAVHEYLHALDDECDMPDDRHGPQWRARLEVMERMFPTHAWRSALQSVQGAVQSAV